MKTATFIALVLLLVLSLGTSVYLLMDQKKVKADLDKSQNDSGEKMKAYKKLAGEIKTAEKEKNDIKNELTAVKKTNSDYKSYKYKYESLKASDDRKYGKMQIKLEEAAKQALTFQEEISTLAASNKQITDRLEKAQSLSTDANSTIAKQKKYIEDISKENNDLKEAITAIKEPKKSINPGKGPSLKNNNPVKLNGSGITRPKRRPPGKITKPSVNTNPR